MLHLIDQFFRGAGSDLQGNAGVLLAELVQQAGQPEKAEGFQDANVQGAVQFAALGQRLLGMVQGVQRRVGVLQKARPLGGQDDPFAHAVEQAHPQFLFQCLDLHGDGGLGVAQTFGGFGKTLQLGCMDEGIQLPDLHGKAP